jgi:hypothetical protein
MDRSDSFLPPYVSMKPVSLWLSVLLLVTAAISAVAAGFEITEIRLLVGVMGDAEITSLQRFTHGLTRHFLMVSRVGLLVATVTLFISWLFFARVNARAFGCRRFTYSRKWAVLAFLLPGVNLIRPLQIVREIWKASDPSGTEHPLAWKAVEVPEFVNTWWWMLLVCGALALLGMAITTSTGATIERLIVARGITTIANLAAAVTAVLGYLVVSGIEEAQDAKWSILSGWAPPTDATPEADDAVGGATAVAANV